VTFGKGRQSPRCTVKGQSGISLGQGFQESSDTHLLEALQAYLIRAWQQQGGLCYPWRSPPGSPSLQLHTPPLQFPAVFFTHLTSQPAPPHTWGHEAKEQGVAVGSPVSPGCSHTCVAGTVTGASAAGAVAPGLCTSRAHASSPTSQGMTTTAADLESFVPGDT